MAPEIAENVRIGAAAADWRVVVFLVAGAIVSTVFFGLAPALQATRLELVRTIRGEVTRDARPSRARNVLIAVQVTASALLLICSAVFLRSALAASTVDPGMRTADTVIVEIVNEPFARGDGPGGPGRTVRRGRGGIVAGHARQPRAASPKRPPANRPSRIRFVSPEYFSVLGIDVLQRARLHAGGTHRDAAVAVVSDAVARQLWPERDAVGQVLHLEPDPNSETRRVDEPPLPSRTFTVVGVVRDVAGFRVPDFRKRRASTSRPAPRLPRRR